MPQNINNKRAKSTKKGAHEAKQSSAKYKCRRRKGKVIPKSERKKKRKLFQVEMNNVSAVCGWGGWIVGGFLVGSVRLCCRPGAGFYWKQGRIGRPNHFLRWKALMNGAICQPFLKYNLRFNDRHPRNETVGRDPPYPSNGTFSFLSLSYFDSTGK